MSRYLIYFKATRKFFVEGWGLDALPGDLVCVFVYGCTPFIIRPLRSVSTYKFLGECNVHGLMGSEALDMMDQGVVQSTSFDLE